MSHIERHRTGTIETISLNRPDKRNPLSAGMVTDLAAALTELSHDETLRVIVITGKGSVFSAGADLAELDAMREASIGEHAASSASLAGLFALMRRHPKPLIARVNGHAVAGGCGLALACDFAIAADHAKLGFTEVRIGFVPAVISTLLRESIVDRRVRDLLLSGRLIEAAEAVRIGLLTRAVDASQLDDTVESMAHDIANETSGTAVALTKRLLAATQGLPQTAAFKFLAAYNAIARGTDDCKEGVTAFLEKRKPDWN